MAAGPALRPSGSPGTAWLAVLRDAVVVVLVRPASLAVGLAGFLARGGIVLLALPVVVLPTPTGLQNVLGGPVSTLLFGGPSAALIALIVTGAVVTVGVVVLGMLAAAWAEQAGIRLTLEAAIDEGLPVRVPRGPGGPGSRQIFVLRALGLLPFAVALVALWPALYDAAYRELVLPDELQTPIVIRIVRAVPGQVLVLAGALLAGDAASMVAVRRLMFEPRRLVVAWVLGWVELGRRAPRVLGTELVTVGAAVLLIGPAVVASVAGWERVRVALVEARDPVATIVATGLFVAAWSGGLVLAGWAAAFRNAAWTLDQARTSDG